ncbi:MAG TPA: GerMN domain-containing protein, partial [Phytomonospora sp.]
MDRRRTSMLAVVLSAGVALSGCGVPTEGPATEIAIEQNDGSEFTDPGAAPLEPQTDPEESLVNYLGAVAGVSTTRAERLNKFYDSPSTDTLEQAQVNVFRRIELTQLPDSKNGATNFRLRGEIIGVYDQWGQLSPPDGKRDFTMSFRLTQSQPDLKWRLVELPPRLLLDAQAFTNSYEASPLYFQRVGSTSLVPDIRYSYTRGSEDRRREELVDWLLHGPSEWLKSAVTTAFPAGAKLNRPPTPDGGALVIDLNSDAVTGDEEKMAAQLAWTLWDVAAGLSLRLERNAQPLFESTINAYLDRNPTAAFV